MKENNNYYSILNDVKFAFGTAMSPVYGRTRGTNMTVEFDEGERLIGIDMDRNAHYYDDSICRLSFYTTRLVHTLTCVFTHSRSTGNASAMKAYFHFQYGLVLLWLTSGILIADKFNNSSLFVM